MDRHRDIIHRSDMRTCVRKYAFEDHTDLFDPYLKGLGGQ